MGASLLAHMIKNRPAIRETWVLFLGQEDPLEKRMTTPVFLPGEFHEQKSMAGYSSWGGKELDMTEGLNNKKPGIGSIPGNEDIKVIKTNTMLLLKRLRQQERELTKNCKKSSSGNTG